MGWWPTPRVLFWVGSLSPLSDFRVIRAHGLRMGIDDLSAPSGRFLARVTAAVATDDRLRSHGDFFPEADTAFASVFAVPSEGGTGSAEAPATAILSPSMLLPRRAPHSASTPPRSLIWPRPSLRRLSTRHLRLPCCLRATPPLGAAEEQPLPLAPSHLLLIMASGPAGLLVHPLDVLTPRRESHGRDRLWPSLRPPPLPPRLPRRYPSRPATNAPSLWELPF